MSAVPPPQVRLTMDDIALRKAMADYAQLKIKSDATVVNKAMRYWVPFAGKKVRMKTPYPSRLRAKLIKKMGRRPPRTGAGKKTPFMSGSGPSLSGHPLSGSVVAGILAGQLAKKYGSVAGSGLSAQEFYSKAERMLGAKVGSVNYLRAGFIPIYRALRVPPKFAPKNHSRFKGRSGGMLAKPNPFRKAEAYAVNDRAGTSVITPNAFRDSVPEVTRMFRHWIMQDTLALARRTGFTVTATP